MDIGLETNPYEYYKHSNKDDFSSKIKQNIAPLFQIVANQGFAVVDKL